MHFIFSIAHVASTLNTWMVNIDLIEEINKYVDENLDSHIDGLRRLVQQPSVSAEGYGTRECATMIKERLLELGFDMARLYSEDGNPIVFGEYYSHSSDTRKTLLLYGAYDSNPVSDESWRYPPFEGIIVRKENVGDCMIGRGVNNKMKISGILNAIDALNHVIEELPVNLLVVMDGEEELFSPTLSRFVSDYEDWLQSADALYMPFSSQNAQGTVRVQLGYKGILFLELESSGKVWKRGPEDYEIHSMHRPVVDNPVWHLINALSTMTGPNGNRVEIEGFENDIVEPDREFQELMVQLAKTFDVDSYKKDLGVSNLLIDSDESLEILKLMFTTAQINIDGIWGGYIGVGPEAIIPQKATAKIEVRLIANQASEKVLQKIKHHLQKQGFADIVIRKLAAVEPCQSSFSEEISQSLIRTYDKLGISYQIWPSSIATIPIYLFNHPPLKLPFATGCVGFGGHSHASDEYAVVRGQGTIAGLAEYEKCIANLICEYGY
jgi:acetylornithine deacetylase/succinyl-diaminopimelate desuccinylase-like protein